MLDSQQLKPVVVHIILRFDIGGMEQVLIDTVNGLNNDYQHVVVCLTTATDVHAARLPSDTKIIQLNQAKANSWRQWLRVYQIFKSNNAAVCHSYNISTIEYQWFAMLAGVKVRVHAEHGRSSNDIDGTYWKYLMIRKLSKTVVSKWVLVSTELLVWAKETLKVKNAKLLLIQNGVDTSKFYPSQLNQTHRGAHWPKQLQPRSNYVFGTVGRLDPVKNQKLLLEAFAQLLTQVPNESADKIKLAIIGDGAERMSLENLAESLNISQQVYFAGARQDIALLLPEFDAFVLSSDAEGLPVTMLEAMSCALPCICTNVGGIANVLNQQNGYLVSSGNAKELCDAMQACYENKEMSRRLGKLARQTVVDKFDNQRMIDQYDSAYNKALKK